MSKNTKLFIIWCVALTILAITVRSGIYYVGKWRVSSSTSDAGKYKHNIKIGVDWFSGYSILRSRKCFDNAANTSIKLDFVNDDADYLKRIKALQNGDIQAAVFTIDSYITVCDKIGYTPGSIVAIIDETRGADAVVAYSGKYKNIDALSNFKFVVVKNSPSETLAKVIMAHFNVRGEFIYHDTIQQVYDDFRKSDQNTNNVYVMWEPYITKATENPNVKVLIDSSAFKGYLTDVLVINKDFLYNYPHVINDLLKSYFTARHDLQDSITKVVINDSVAANSPLSKAQADNLVDGIWFKNIRENYVHFGIESNESLQHIDSIISNINKVLMKTDTVKSDVTVGKPDSLYYSGILKSLYDSQFLVSDEIRIDTGIVKKLSDQQWQQLRPIGKLDVPKLVFARGRATLTDSSIVSLDELVQLLGTYTSYYVQVIGSASNIGDVEANKKLAYDRAQVVVDYLISKGINQNRVKVFRVDIGTTEVSFVFGEL